MVITNDRTIVSREEAERLLYQTTESAPAGFANLETAQRFNYTPADAPNFDAFEALASQPKYMSAPAMQTFESPLPTSSPALESYVTNTQQLTQRPEFQNGTFRPQLFDTQTLEKVEYSPAVELEKIAEVEIHDTAQIHEMPTRSREQDQVIKLNRRGIIAVASFFAVLALVTVLVIINAINLGQSGARLDSLRASNTEMRQDMSGVNAERQAYLANLTPEELASRGLTQLPITNLPSQSNTWQQPSNPDHSTNWFNNLSRFLSGLFR